MKDFLVYHNPDEMGIEIPNPLSIVTNKSVTDAIMGDRVWLLTASGKPRTFLLKSYFIIDQLDMNVGGFRTKLSGATGKVFEPMMELSHLQWFNELKKSQGNFAFGLQRIKDERFVRGLEKLAGV